jgi:hypothetical protein
MANGNLAPKRVIEGQATKLSRTIHEMDYDPIHDEIVVTNPQAGAILVFRGSANGNEAPVRVIQGSNTRLFFPHTVSVDTRNDEILVGDPGRRGVLVFPRDGNGNIPPKREVTPRSGFWIVGTAVDPINDLLVVALRIRVGGQGALYIYNRTAAGDAEPRAIIAGPKTGILSPWQVEIFDGKIYVALANNVYRALYEGVFQREGVSKDVEILSPWRSDVLGSVSVWNVTDSGDVAPRAIIKGPVSDLVHPGGVALNPKLGEIYASDSVRNGVYTYLVPEFFGSMK